VTTSLRWTSGTRAKHRLLGRGNPLYGPLVPDVDRARNQRKRALKDSRPRPAPVPGLTVAQAVANLERFVKRMDSLYVVPRPEAEPHPFREGS
jgi:hypothetical protein